jgi:energy-coupling factor transporter ATP-binding protein EcfA2
VARLSDFFTAVTGVGEQGYLEVRLKKGTRWESQYAQTPADAARLVAELRSQGDVFFGVCPRTAALPRKPSSKENVAGAKVLWADLDISEEAIEGTTAWETIRLEVLPPSYVVATGHGLHLYWLLTEFISDIAQVEDLNQTIAKNTTHADTVHDAVRIMRVPGTWNYKEEPPLKTSFVVAAPDRKYPAEAVKAFFVLQPEIRKILLTGSTAGYESRSERDWAALLALARFRAPYSAVLSLFQSLAVGDKLREAGEQYLEHSYQRAEERAQKAITLEKWGLFEHKEAYWKKARGGRDAGFEMVSTFTVEVDQILQGPEEDILIGDVVADARRWKGVQFPRSAFVTVTSLARHLKVAEWQWLGTDNDVRKLLPMLLESMPASDRRSRVAATTMLGWHRNVWVGSVQTVNSTGQVLHRKSAPIVYIDPNREAPEVHYTNLTGAPDTDLLELLESLNEKGVIWPVVSWFAATFYKPRLELLGYRFPILHLWGTRGSGKSTLLKLMQRLVGITNPVAYNCSTTNFVLLSLMGSSNAVPVALTEFRHSTLSQNDYARILRLLLMSYDAGADARGRADQTTVTYPLTAPLTLDGEDLIADAAMHERIVAINMKPGSILPGTPFNRAFRRLDANQLERQAGPLLVHSLRENPSQLLAQAQEVVSEALAERILPDRVFNNHVILGVGMLSYLRLTDRGELFTASFVKEALAQSVESIVEYSLGRTRLIVDEMVEDLVSAVAQGNARFPHKYEDIENILWIHLTTSLGWWLAKRRREGRSALEQAAIKAQLRERTQGVDGVVEPGQYVLERKGKSVRGVTMWCYGISLDACLEAGLDIPDRLNITEITVEL